MSSTVGDCSSCSEVMDLEENIKAGKKNENLADEVDMNEKREDEKVTLGRCCSEISLDDEEEDEGEAEKVLDLGPQVTLKDQLEKDKVFFLFFFIFCIWCFILIIKTKNLLLFFVILLWGQDDESLRRWKEQLLGSVDLNSVGGENFLLFSQLSAFMF